MTICSVALASAIWLTHGQHYTITIPYPDRCFDIVDIIETEQAAPLTENSGPLMAKATRIVVTPPIRGESVRAGTIYWTRDHEPILVGFRAASGITEAEYRFALWMPIPPYVRDRYYLFRQIKDSP